MSQPRTKSIPEWAQEMVRALMADHLEAVCGDDATEDNLARICAELERRLAIGLVQARAMEARHINGETTVIAMQAKSSLVQTVAMTIATQCMNRSHALEQIGMEMANAPVAAAAKVVIQ